MKKATKTKAVVHRHDGCGFAMCGKPLKLKDFSRNSWTAAVNCPECLAVRIKPKKKKGHDFLVNGVPRKRERVKIPTKTVKFKTVGSICMFCGSKGKDIDTSKDKCADKLCQAKGEIFRAYCKKNEPWQVMAAVHQGRVNLDAEAKALLWDRQEAQKKKHTDPYGVET